MWPVPEVPHVTGRTCDGNSGDDCAVCRHAPRLEIPPPARVPRFPIRLPPRYVVLAHMSLAFAVLLGASTGPCIAAYAIVLLADGMTSEDPRPSLVLLALTLLALVYYVWR